MSRAEGYPGRIERYLKRLILLPQLVAEAVERCRAIEARLAAIPIAEPLPIARPAMSLPEGQRDFPALTQADVANAVLFADRETALDAIPQGGRVAEIGVALGSYSDVMLRKLKPSRFDAFDLFLLHEVDHFWGKSSTEWFAGRTHKGHYEHRFRDAIRAGIVHVHEGDSSTLLAEMPDASYGAIYIDGDHSYDGVLRDAEVATRKLADDGFLVFNDYVMADHTTGSPYGVVPVVNDFCANRGWTVAYFALQRDLFCDIALRRAPN